LLTLSLVVSAVCDPVSVSEPDALMPAADNATPTPRPSAANVLTVPNNKAAPADKPINIFLIVPVS
jgi:hypothetical protein